jgi:hypothetical protein
MGSEAANDAATNAANSSVGIGGGPQAGDSSYTDYSDADMGPVGNYTMFDEATAKANLQSVVDNMKANMTKDMDFSQKYAFNLSINNPFTSTFGKIGNSVLSPIGTTLSSFSYNPDLAGDRRYTDYGNTQRMMKVMEVEEMEEHLFLLLTLPFLLLILPKIETIDYIKVLIILFILCKQFLVVE